MAKKTAQTEKEPQVVTTTLIVFQIEGSSQITFLTYKPVDKELITKFRRGGEYIYYDVSEEELNLVLSAESIGTAHREIIVATGKECDKVIE